MSKFIEKVEKTCQENQKVAMFIDMDGTIAVYNVYPEDKVAEKMEEDYDNAEPLKDIIKTLEKISQISNIDLYILSLSKTSKLTEKKKKWLEKNTPFIPKKNWLIITKEIGEYNKENRDIIKAKKIEEKGEQYDHLILLDDDHKVLREAQKKLGKNADIYHVSAALI